MVCTPGKKPLAEFALEVGAFALRFFTDYFNIPYPGEKVDLVAIPDFAAGAMENLGCITFRDTALLVDTAKAARTELERVADVIAHELAHMWFGDLVTMGWWEGIWLNEAFATFMETLCVDAFRPSWDRWVGFAPSREAALAVDSVHSTRPIEYPVGPPKEAEGMFDLLTYEKGCGVLRMLEQHIGSDVFRDGVRTYLKAHAYGNTVTTDLWDALEDASGAPVRDVMDTFILQGGHPLVSLHGDTLGQQPFALGPVPAGRDVLHRDGVARAGRGAGAAHRRTSPARRVRHLVLGTEPEPIEEAGRGLAVVNAGGWGMFRVGYETEHRLALAEHLSELTPLERANLLGDTWATTLAGHSRPSGVPGPGVAAGAGARPGAVGPGRRGARALPTGSRGPSTTDALHQAVAALIGPTYRHLGFDATPGESERTPIVARAGHQPDGHRRRRRRGAGRGGAALRRVAHRRRLGRPHPGRHRGGHARRRGATRAARRLRRAPGALPDRVDTAGGDALARGAGRLPRRRLVPAHVRAGHDRGAQPERVQRHRRAAGQPASATRPCGTRLTESWDAVLERFPKNAPPRILESLPALCADADFAERAIAFLDDHPLASGPRRVAQSIERLRVNVAFAARERAGLADSLRAAGPPTS